eukprot:Amastigsp_a174380_19.p7 type:complete len:130 gc:universal Amastigsp_a174380_19:1207-818(-)
MSPVHTHHVAALIGPTCVGPRVAAWASLRSTSRTGKPALVWSSESPLGHRHVESAPLVLARDGHAKQHSGCRARDIAQSLSASRSWRSCRPSTPQRLVSRVVIAMEARYQPLRWLAAIAAAILVPSIST